jgi:hypothetical protein
MKLLRIVPVLAALACSLAGEAEAVNAEKSKSTVSIVRAVVSGSLEGGDGEFSMLLEGFAFKADHEHGVPLAADALFGSTECTTLDRDVNVEFHGLTRATVEGTATANASISRARP